MSLDLAHDAVADDIDRYPSPEIWVNPDRLGGEPCFAGTRVPVRALFDHLRAGYSFDVFLDGYEGVTREQVVAVISLAERGLPVGELEGIPGR